MNPGSACVRGIRPILLMSLASAILPCCTSHMASRSDTERTLRLVANRVVSETSYQLEDRRTGHRYASSSLAPPDADLALVSSSNDWRYWNGVLGLAMIRVGEVLQDSAFAGYASKNVSFVFDNAAYFQKRHSSQGKWEYPLGQFFVLEELDDCGAMGAVTIEVNKTDSQSRYKEYLERASMHIAARQGRLDDGTLVRSFPRKWTLWADDLYMSVVFLSRMGEVTGHKEYFDDAAMQVLRFHEHLLDPSKGLMHHCWYSESGLPGVAFWGRANGWALLAQVDLLDRLPAAHPRRDTLLSLFRLHVEGIARYQGVSGLWRQLLDRQDSFEETSCSAMFTYAIARGVKKGYLDPGYVSTAQRGWKGILSKIRADGQIEGICAGTGVSDDLTEYYKRPTPVNDPHGIGAVLLAGTEAWGSP